MEGQLNGLGEMVPGHRVPEGTDLEIAYNLQGDDLVLRVNKAGVQVFRVWLKDANEALRTCDRKITKRQLWFCIARFA